MQLINFVRTHPVGQFVGAGLVALIGFTLFIALGLGGGIAAAFFKLLRLHFIANGYEFVVPILSMLVLYATLAGILFFIGRFILVFVFHLGKNALLRR